MSVRVTPLRKTRRRGVITAAALAMALLTGGGIAAAHTDTDTIGVDVVGGHEATEPYPAMASLQTNHRGDPDFHFCGATLVSRTWAVTNAHCVTNLDGTPMPTDILHLRIGSPNRRDGGVVTGVTQVLPHASWDWLVGPGRVADIAMLRLDTYVQVQHIETAPRLAARGAVTRMLGWGLTEPDSTGIDTPLQLQELDSRTIPTGRCAEAGISVGEFCVNSPHGTDGACYGDSGGPALQKVTADRWQLVGGVSRGAAVLCGDSPEVFTDMTHYRPWMFQVMRTGTVPPAAPGEEATPPSAPATAATAAAARAAAARTWRLTLLM